jgi:hypothetical protein
VLDVADRTPDCAEGVVALGALLRPDALGSVSGFDSDEGAGDVRHRLAPQLHFSLLTSTRVLV